MRNRFMATLATVVLAAAPLGLWGVGTAHAAGGRTLAAPQFLQELHPGRALAGSTLVHATLALQSRSPSGLANLAAAVSSPTNPLYHHWLTAQQVMAEYGPSPTATRALVSTLRQDGFQVRDNGWTLSTTGPAARWSALLDTRLATYQWHGHTFRGQEGAATLPGWMAADVSGVSGLTNFLPPAPSKVIKKPTQVAAKRDMALAAGSPHPASVTAESDGFSVTATIPGGANKPTGMPVHVVLQASFDGVPDSDAGLAPTNDPVATSNTGLAPASSFLYGLDGGDIVLGLYSHSAMTASEQVTVYSVLDDNGYPISGYPSVTLTLPPITWTGPTTLQALTASDINQVYGASQLVSEATGKTPNVGVFSAGPPSAATLAALSTFVAQDQILSPTISVVPVSTGAFPPGTGWGGETNLDLQALASAAPGAHITMYSDPAFDVAAMLQDAMNHPVSAISFSFGAEGIDQQAAPLAQALTVEGVSLLVSSGDSGSQTGNFPVSYTPPVMPPAVSEPADLAPVTAIGGTDVAVTTTLQVPYTQAWGGAYLGSLTPLGQQEMLEVKAASGGGYSSTTPIPSWQVPFLPPGTTGRGVPDIALLADPNVAGITLVGRSGTAEIGGGTSLGTPLMAGWVADMDAVSGGRAGSLDPLLYQLASVDPDLYTQSVAGDNGAYQITSQDNTPGTWNPVTGLGSPNISELARAVIDGTAPTVFVRAVSPIAYPAPVTVTASSLNLESALYQYWVQNPQNGVWSSSGAFTASASYTFTPPVPGAYHVMVAAKSASGGAVTDSPVATVAVTSNAAMVSSLTVTSTAGPGVQPAGASVTFTANATDPANHAEYQFWMHGPSGQWQMVQPYSLANSYTAADLAPGSYAVAVYALDEAQVASGAWNQAYQYATVVNVASAVSLSVPATGTAGMSLTATANASGITNPVYQFWIEAPNGTWSQSGAYQSSGTYTFTPTMAGTYRVVVYAKDPYAPATSQFAVTASALTSVSG